MRSNGSEDPCPLRIEGLEKRYGRLRVLQGLGLRLPTGAVYGLVGLNGSGKTTTIKCALGLLHPDAGRVDVLGVPPDRIHRTGARVAAVFDSPCLHPDLTVRQVLEHARLLGGPRCRSAAEAEELLGLGPYRRVRIRKLSLGNARRASIAHALVGRPELAVLDEPFSGLDARGIRDVLDLILGLHRSGGTTFLLSSHQLPYLEEICTHIGILHEGRIPVEGPLGDVLRARSWQVRIRASEPSRALDLLRLRPGVRSAEIDLEGGLRISSEGGDGAAALNRALVEGGIEVSELIARPPSLEALFRDVTGGRR